MKEQHSWSKQSSLVGPFNLRQRSNTRSRSMYSSLYCSIVDISDDELKVKISFDKKELNELYLNTFFYFDIKLNEFINVFGSPSSFRELLKEKPLYAKLIYQTPNILEGKVVLFQETIFKFDSNEKTEGFSLGGIINGMSDSNKKKIRVIKFREDKESNTGIKLSDKSIHIAAESDRFLEVNEKGISISGPVNIQANPSQLTFGGLVTLPDFYTGMIPSTVSTPNPVFKPKLPTELLKLIKDLSTLATSLMM